jgi:PhzF family phenazine biosynthesis protein
MEMNMQSLPLYQVDAFADAVFGGNPAAVCPLERWLDGALMQAIAAENNLSETAFFVPATSSECDFELRWFTPTSEVDLCGHATLAAAHVVYQHLGFKAASLRFHSRSGVLKVTRAQDGYALDFPEWTLERVTDDDSAMARALGVVPQEIYRSEDWVVVLESAAQVRSIRPDESLLKALEARGVIITASGDAGSGVDCVSRAFFPKLGIAEDPVTGSAHCALTPYWSKRLSKAQLIAEQGLSRRGRLRCKMLAGGRVEIAGNAQLYLEGRIFVPHSFKSVWARQNHTRLPK